MIISSSAFNLDEEIPKRYTCDGQNVSPPIDFFDVPEGTQDLVLIVEDPDATPETFIHWIIWNINPKFDGIGEGNVTEASIEGKNSNGENHYSGPCPPSGRPHRYYFRLYALSDKLNLQHGSSVAELRAAMDGKVIDEDSLMGFYQRG